MRGRRTAPHGYRSIATPGAKASRRLKKNGSVTMQTLRLSGSAIVHIVFVVIAAYVIWVARDLPSGGGMMPIFAACGVIAFSLFHIAREILTKKEVSYAEIFQSLDNRALRVVIVFSMTAAYIFLIFRLGYFLSTFLYLCACAAALGVGSWRVIALAAVALLPAMYGFFVLFLGANLPRGLLI